METQNFAVIRRSDKSKEGLPVKKLSKVIEELENDGYKIYNEII